MAKIQYLKKFFIFIISISCVFVVISKIGDFLDMFDFQEKNIIEEENKNLINKIFQLETSITERNLQIEKLNEDVANKKTQIIEKEKIIYRDGSLYIPPYYDDLKNNYIVLEKITKDKDEIILTYEEKSKKDDEVIFNLYANLKETKKALENSNYLISDLSKKKWFEHSILLGVSTNLNQTIKSIDASYLILIKEKVFVGFGFSTDLSFRASIGVKF